MKASLKLAQHLAQRGIPLLLAGETGSGKEVFARALHELSHRYAGPFVAVNCAAIPEALIESELFGYRKGAFTGPRAKAIAAASCRPTAAPCFSTRSATCPSPCRRA